jgi:DNA-binding NarL/FixJ family response regulator
MMDVVAFALVVVDVVSAADWLACRRLVQSGRSPIAVLTNFLAEDRSYRRFAFEMGVRAYAGKPCTGDRLREMLSRLDRGERCIELVNVERGNR